MSNNDIDIVFVTDKKIFDSNYINNLKQIGNVIFCSRENFITKIISNKNKKIIVYDPDFVRQTFPQEILTQSKNVLAIFLGITDDYYIDLDICKKKSIQVFTIPEYVDNSVVEYLIMMMLSYAKKNSITLTSKKIGIIGLTNIGKKIADICDVIGMKVFYWDKKIRQTNYDFLELNKMFEICDFIYFCFEERYENIETLFNESLQLLNNDTIFISFKDNKIKEKVNKPNVIEIDKNSCYTDEDNNLKIKKWYKNITDYIHESYTAQSENQNKSDDVIIVNIRKAKAKDIPAIVELYKKENWLGNDNSIEKIIKNYNYKSKRDYLLVAECKGKIIGSVSFGINKSYAFNCMKYIVFDYLVVQKQYRRKRVGTQLIGALVSIAKKKNLESIWGVSSIGRNKAHKFYTYVGFDDPVKGFRKVFIQEQ